MDDDVCIVMEYMAKGSLYHLLRKEDVEISYALIKKVFFLICYDLTV
jgi:hypothetical protein